MAARDRRGSWGQRLPGGVEVDTLVEVRLLGPFHVRATSGEVIPPSAWRTAKTRSLLRLLAMSAGEPVSSDRLVATLWPDVAPERGRASLRTAVSLIRQLIGDEHLLRRAGALVLTGAWIDARAFEAQAETARLHVAAGRLADVVESVWEGVSLYSGDLCADEPHADWAAVDRERYRRLAQQLLLDGAEAAWGLRWLRDAAEFGHRALRLDPYSERAYRVLMRTYWHLGETKKALSLFAQCRHAMVEELGVDPDPETQALHLDLLRPSKPLELMPSFVGRGQVLSTLAETMRIVHEERRPASVVMTGPPGSGRSRTLAAAVQQWPYRAVTIRCRGGHASGSPGAVFRSIGRALGLAHDVWLATDLRELLGTEPVLVALDDLEHADPRSVEAVAALLRETNDPLLVVATTEPCDDDEGHPLMGLPLSQCVDLPPMPREEVAALLECVLGREPAASLVDEVAPEGLGLPGSVVQAARAMCASGELVAAAHGLVRVPHRLSPPVGTAAAVLASAREHVGSAGGRAIDLLAVLDRWTDLQELARLAEIDPDELAGILDNLTDLGAVAHDPRGYRMRDELAQQAAYRWLRPSMRARLHRGVAERARLPAADRTEHWLQCGEPALAAAAALEAADAAVVRGDYACVRSHLLRVAGFAEQHCASADDCIALQERLAEAAQRLGRRDEARRRLVEAATVARDQAPHALARLQAALGRLADSAEQALAHYEQAAGCPGATGEELGTISLLSAAASAESAPADAISLLRRAVEQADTQDDMGAQIDARVLLSLSAAQRRDFETSQEAARTALSLAEVTDSPRLFARAAHALVVAPACLGRGQEVLPLLRRALDAAVAAPDAGLTSEIRLTLSLVLHDLGSDEFVHSWALTCAPSQEGAVGRLHDVLEALVSLDRGQLRRAAQLLEAQPERSPSAVVAHAVDILRARLHERRGEHALAVSALTAVVVDDRSPMCPLFLPEAHARLAELLAGTEPALARVHLAQAGETAGAQVHPREQICLLRARAALLAQQGDLASGATMALTAALAARKANLPFEEAGAYALRAQLWEVSGATARAARNAATAAKLFGLAGAPLRAAEVRGKREDGTWSADLERAV